ncbi:tachykinin-like peptides receptor 99D [Watersipora subatra]|uniref:tachykinin-like peptides receptor 99D n=1 Tax=Watersipora subatra TaxID=2589382 RepID=UPI00355BA00C
MYQYLAICHPLFHYKLKEKKKAISACSMVVIWMIGLLVAIGDAYTVRLSLSANDLSAILESGSDEYIKLFKSELLFVPDLAYYDETGELVPGVKTVDGHCQDLDMFSACKPNKHTSDIVFFILMYIIPQSIFGFCYISISHHLWIRKPVSDSSQLSDQHFKIKKTARRITVIMMIMVIIFGLLWLPYWSKKMYDVSEAKTKRINEKPAVFEVVDMVFNICTYICILSSPITYLIMDRDFRKLARMKRQFCWRHASN